MHQAFWVLLPPPSQLLRRTAQIQVSAARHFFHSHFFLRWSLLVQDAASAKFVFCKQRRIQWNLVPVGERITRFDAETLVLQIAIKAFLLDFEREPEAIR